MHRFVCLLATAALGLTACVADEDVGQLDLSLTGTSASGITYRLRDAELTISGVGTPIVFHTEDDPNRTLITEHLDVGNYNLHLGTGWRLERLGTGGVAETVEATLISPDPQAFTIAAGVFTPVVLRFRTSGEVVDMGQGDVGVSIGVEDTFDSCLAIHNGLPSATDGTYSIDRGAGPIVVFCDMTHGGVTYEQAAFGNSFASYAGYSWISAAELNDPVIQQAFIALYNLQGNGLVNLDTTYNSGNCCIKAADGGPGLYLLLAGEYIYPATPGGPLQCSPGYTAAIYSFGSGISGQAAPAPLPADYFITHPASNGSACGDAENPGWFFKRY
jgi:hypothetical protein